MATRDFLLPDLGEGLASGEIAAWLVDVGDVVEVDQPVAEIETAKAVVEVPAPHAGVVVARHAEQGSEVEVGRPLISIDTQVPPAAPDTGYDPQSRGEPEAGRMREARPESEPRAESEATAGSGQGSGSVLVGYGVGDAPARRRRARRAPDEGPGAGEPPRPLAKPPVRKLAKDLGVDLATVTASGDGGVVTREDVRAAAGHRQGPAEAPAGAPAGEHRIPLSAVRREIARRMTRSRREIPEATTWVDADATGVLALRDALVARHPEVTPLAVVLRLAVLALQHYPELNARLDEDAGELVVAEDIHLGIAVSTDRGLLVPVIRDAGQLSVPELAGQLTALAADARGGRLAPSQLRGSTFSVTNYGSFGVDGGNPVINHPEAAILGVGRIRKRPWVVDDDVVVRPVVEISLVFDHRVCDGAAAGGFLRELADGVEQPVVLLAGG